ncbi:MAG: hypothetical protein HKN16_02970 [Saprospiraceae bacterium]|nr:hypothetical protein [Saprospiraceae bacterium]
MLKDKKVNVKVKLAFFWVALMFLYIYNDIFSMYQPGHAADLVAGHLEGMQFTPKLLLGAAALMAIPSIMILLSLILKAKVNRSVNIILAVFHILVLIGTQFVGDTESWHYWRFNELLQVFFLGIIIWTAWKWPTLEPSNV